MKNAAIIEYSQNKEKIKAIAPVHRQYFRGFLEDGQLRAAGPLADDAGATWVLEVETTEEAEEIIKSDPHFAAGVFVKWQIRPLAYWSAKEAKGE
jgi:uncharacterized protein YciI